MTIHYSDTDGAYNISDDFITMFTFTGSAGGSIGGCPVAPVAATSLSSNASAGHPGVGRLTIGNGATGTESGSALYLIGSTINDVGKGVQPDNINYCAGLLRPGSSISPYQCAFGVCSQVITGAPFELFLASKDMIGFLFDDTVSAFWTVKTRFNTTETSTTTAVTFSASTWYLLEWRRVPPLLSGTSSGGIEFSINKTVVATHTTNIPTTFTEVGGGVGPGGYVGFWFRKTGTSIKTLDVDWFQLEGSPLGARV